VVKLLLKHGADAQAAATTGWTALHAASKNGHESVVKILLEYRAQIFRANKNGDTALLVVSLAGC
jgi:ankyrin repeat protein